MERIFIRTHPLPHTKLILPQMYVELSPMAVFGNHGYTSISYPTPLSAHGHSNVIPLQRMPHMCLMDVLMNECVGLCHVRHFCPYDEQAHFCELEIKAHQFVAELSERRQSGYMHGTALQTVPSPS